MLLVWLSVSVMAAFKSYPAVGDVLLQVALIPLISNEIKGSRYGVLAATVALFVSVLAPIFWTMWIYEGTGNANFYYAINLVSTMAQVFFITDSLALVLKNDYLLKKKNKQQHSASTPAATSSLSS